MKKPGRLSIVTLATLVVLVAGYAGLQLRRQAALARLPRLPDLDAQTKAIAEHLRDRDRTARAYPSSVDAVAPLCLAYHADLFYDLAERCYALVEAVVPSEWQWTYYRALAEGARGSSSALVGGMRKVVALSPDFGPAWWRLGEAELKEGRYDAAAEAFRRARSSGEPDRTPPAGAPEHVASVQLAGYAALGLARVTLVQGDAEGARQILEPLTTASPGFGPAFRLLGESYTRLGRDTEAARAVAHANRQAPYASYADPLVDKLATESRNSTFLLQQAAAADLADNAPWKEYLLARALEFDPANPAVVYELANVRRSLGRNAEALELFQRYVELVPDDYQGLGQIGSCLGDLGRYGEAESYLRRALQMVDDATTHYHVGFVRPGRGRLAEAVEEYERALERDPSHVNARTNLAVNLVDLGQVDRAAREMTRVLEIDPGNASAHTNLGAMLVHQGQIERGIAEFQEALRLDPKQVQAQIALQALGK